MSDSDTRLQRILRHLILRSFPRLRRKPIDIAWGAEDDLLFYNVEDDRHRIWVNDCLRNAPRRVLEGGIAHELCHIDADLRIGPYARQLSWERYFRSRWHRMREERAIEGRAVELGYAPQLLAFMEYTRRLGRTFTREHGLLIWELRRYASTRRSSATLHACAMQPPER